MARNKILYINVSEDKHQEYKEYAVKHKTNMSELVRIALEEHINKCKENGGDK